MKCGCHKDEAKRCHELLGEGDLYRVSISCYKENRHIMYTTYACDHCIVRDLEYISEPPRKEDYMYFLMLSVIAISCTGY